MADDPSKALKAAQGVCKRHKIRHTTIQVERAGSDDLHNCEEVNTACTPAASAL
jgi:hypothetical protein